MNLATLISVSAALFQASTGVVFLAIARAPGWQRARLFSVMAFSAAAYSAINSLFSLKGIDPQTLRTIGIANFPIASVHCCAWLIYAFGIPDRPWSALPRAIQTLVVFTLVFALGAAVPAIGTREELLTFDVPAFGVVYHQWATTTYAELVGVWLLIVLLLPYGQFVRAAIAGTPWAMVRVVGFSVFFIAAVVEVLVSVRVINFLYTADIGFLAIVLTVLIESVGRVIRDAQSLDEMSQQLVREVDSRTRERDEARDALMHAERLSSLGQLAAGVGHEINNPLTSVRANLEALRETLRPSATNANDTLTIVDEALSGADRIARVVTDLRAYAMPATEHRERVEVPRAVKAALKVASHQLRHVTIVREAIDGTVQPVYADAVRLSQVLVNLLTNAAQAVQEAERPDPTIDVRAYMSGRDIVTIEVEDNGVGIPEDSLRRLSEPYFSTRLDRGGTGLGLFVANGIVTSLGGTLEFESKVGRGTLARVTLPTLVEDAFPDEAAGQTQRITDALRGGTPSTPSHPPLVSSTTQPRVLVVDDEVRVARSIARMLSGMEVVVAESGGQALDIMARDRNLDAILCDVMMPGLSGVDVHHAVASTMPELLPRLCFMTGGATIREVAEFLQQDGVRYLPKPFNKQAVETLLRSIKGEPDAN